jgi:hypothetical protein
MKSWAQAALVFSTTAFAAWAQATYALSSDDIFTLRVCQLPWGELIDALRADVHPPLYFLLTKLWLGVFGSTESALQAFSGVTFLACVATLYFGVPEEDRASAVVLLNPMGLLTARLGRMYALLLLLSVIAVLLERRSKWRPLAAVHLLGSFTHIWYFFFLAGQGYAVLRYRDSPLRYCLTAALALLPYTALWLPVLLGQLEKSNEAAAWLPNPNVVDLFVVTGLLAGFSILNLGFLRTWPNGQYLTQFGATLLIPFALSLVKPIFYGRFTVPALAPLALALPFRTTPAIVGHCVLALLLSAYEWRKPKPCDSVNTAEYLRQRFTAGDQIIFTSLSRAPILYYWPEAASSSFSFPAEIDAHPGYEPNYARLASMPSAQPAAGRVWVLSGFNAAVAKRLQSDLEEQGYRPTVQRECASSECYYTKVLLFTRGQ